VYGRRFGLGRETALRIGAGFAGGMRIAETCGAVTGAIMVLGLCRATAESTTAKRREPVYMAVQQFMTEYERRNRTLICRDLLGCDIRTEEGLRAAKERGLYKTVCPRMVQDAAEILEVLIRADPVLPANAPTAP
jgi:C_GCAxxG_C_C family probable redox protein